MSYWSKQAEHMSWVKCDMAGIPTSVVMPLKPVTVSFS